MRKQNILILTTVLLLVFVTYILVRIRPSSEVMVVTDDSWWQIQSIDTVKYSRDIAREKGNDDTFDLVIDEQLRKIAQIGATHVAVGTPYDPEFSSYLRRWVKAARQNKLNVWFRGNMSGWEGWFGYGYIDHQQHTNEVEKFILSNRDLFEDGDVFDPCPECENGNWGDPRNAVDLREYRSFLIQEYSRCKQAFEKIDKDVRIVYSMNGDVASLVMDKDTTQKLGGVVTIDHYVSDGDELVSDVDKLSERSNGMVLIGEFGAPIPDIHGDLNESQQGRWIDDSLDKLSSDNNVLGVNYWTSFGSSTSLWRDNGVEKPSVSVVNKYFNPKSIETIVKDELGRPIEAVELTLRKRNFKTDRNGNVTLTYLADSDTLTISKEGYKTKTLQLFDLKSTPGIVLQRENEGVAFGLAKKIYKFLKI